MIAQIEQHIKNADFEQALTLIDMLEQVFAEHNEMRFRIQALRDELNQSNLAALESLHEIKYLLVG